MARAFWSGRVQISLVSFGIEMFPATESKGEIHFHQLSRKTGERVRHQNVSNGDDPLTKDDIVKGYEYSKGQYVTIEPEDIEDLRIESRQTLDITQFVDLEELDPQFFEKPYFVTPDGNAQIEAFTVVREALQKTGKIGLGKIAFGGREHLMGIRAPLDKEQRGMMAYVLRYAEELRDPTEYFAGIKEAKVDADQLSLAEELIKRRSSKFDPAKFTDDYEKALRAMVEAKINKVPQKPEERVANPGEVMNLMDALRKSVAGSSGPGSGTSSKKMPAKRAASPGSKLTVLTKPKAKPVARKRSA